MHMFNLSTAMRLHSMIMASVLVRSPLNNLFRVHLDRSCTA